MIAEAPVNTEATALSGRHPSLGSSEVGKMLIDLKRSACQDKPDWTGFTVGP